jgi:hypothetical protein
LNRGFGLGTKEAEEEEERLKALIQANEEDPLANLVEGIFIFTS